MLEDRELLELHRAAVRAPSVSGDEARLADFLERYLASHEVAVERLGNSVLATVGTGPLLLLDTHLDTVPPARGWQRDPWEAAREGGRVYGLGANDAKASVAAMLGAFLAFEASPPPITLALALVEGEETRGAGTEAVLSTLEHRGRPPAAAVVGEPTGLDVAIAQKGLLILRLAAAGDAGHAANARALGLRNAIRGLVHDLAALEAVDLGPDHPGLGPTTCEPTLIAGGTARNMVPGAASATLDLRTTPAVSPDALIERIQRALAHTALEVVSRRLEPRDTAREAIVVQAAARARPAARLYASSTMSDMVFFKDIPAVKVGPGRSERSHAPDEFVLEHEILEGRRFYVDLIKHYVALTREEASDGETVGQG